MSRDRISGATTKMIGRLLPLRRFLRERRGTAMIEFAFVAPVLFVLTIGTIDVGRLVWSVSMLHHMAREATRYASVHGSAANNPASTTDLQTYVDNRLIGIPASDVAVTSNCVDPNTNALSALPCAAGYTVQVQLDYTYTFLLGSMIGLNPMAVQGDSSMVVL